ncbi:MAG: response regulator [Gammaproteobacteria bacterium]|jgi:two-component system chemotaxis response regulator CheY|nr:response regulator [Gammaproteobacteria bacterium]MBT4608125.1 response regulator [Thiotrichales bacterium]MBT3471215.1 response regulator [Gammaproteobacteria bacterium]MBT3966642.1 response regulator [Gammaproteobacteria bacterium]MBT4081116.1 response regulator [Gammaproteobacteria bacterium]
MRILTVDDSVTVTNMVRFSLKKAGIECDVAADGLEGLRKIRVTTPPYDFVLCDVFMPKMDGMEMLRQVRKSCPAYRHVPFVFLSTNSEEAVKGEARALGVKAWMKKPFSPETLVEIVQRFGLPNG